MRTNFNEKMMEDEKIMGKKYIKKIKIRMLIFSLILVLSSVSVFADGWTSDKPSHSTLYADTLTSKTDASPVSIADSQGLFVTGDISTLGKVGIGTAGPDNLLTIGSSSGAPTPRQAIRINNAGFSAPGAWNTDANGDKIIFWNNNIDADNRIGLSANTAFWLKGMGSTATNLLELWGSTANSGSPTQIVTVQKAGNVGIGTSNPAGRLHIVGPPWSGAYIPQLTVEAPTHINTIFDRTDTQDFMTLTVGSAGTGIHFGNSNRFFISADPYSDRNTGGWGNEVFSILPSGNVGIGTSSPTAKLDIRAPEFWAVVNPLSLTNDRWFQALEGDGDKDDSGRIWMEYGPQAAPLLVMTDFDDPPRLEFRQTGNGNELAPQFSSWIGLARGLSSDIAIMGGNVGIGTTSPGSILSVNHATDPRMEFTSTNGLAYLSKYSGTWFGMTNPFIVQSNSGDMVFTPAINSPSSGMVIKSGGNVGIGTTNPSKKLDVAGDIQTSGQLASQGGRIRRDFVTWSTTASTPRNIHIKTNIPVRSSIMYRILVEGYNYGESKAINSDAVGYTYSGWSCTGNTQENNYANGVSISQYCSSDGYVVIKMTAAASMYYLGFSASAWLVNPTGVAFDISGTVYQQDANL